MGRRAADLASMSDAQQHAALQARAERLERCLVGNPAGRRELMATKRLMLELERRA